MHDPDAWWADLPSPVGGGGRGETVPSLRTPVGGPGLHSLSHGRIGQSHEGEVAGVLLTVLAADALAHRATHDARLPKQMR